MKRITPSPRNVRKAIKYSELKLKYEELPFRPFKYSGRLPSVWQDVKSVVKWIWQYFAAFIGRGKPTAHKLSGILRHTGRRAVSLYKHLDHHLTVKDAILILLGLLLVWTLFFRDHVVAEPLPIKKPVTATYKPLKQSKLKKQSKVAQIAPPAPRVAPAVPRAVSGCQTYFSGDYYLDKIIRYESSGNSCATNAGGCFGLLQACPGAPLRAACGGNPACQIQWFKDNKTGGRSWAQVWQHELDFGWW